MDIPFVDLRAQYESIKTEIDTAIADVLSKSAFIGGPFVKAFESAFASFCGAKHCIGVGNGTDGLFVVLKAMGIGPGDEVITAANSFIATSEAITMAGARVVFADIRPDTYTIDPDDVERKITRRTKAIIPVHLFGHPADMEPILGMARRHGLKVVEDAAQAHGAEYENQTVGTLADAACFSFYPGKNLGAYGDAGAIVTGDDALALKSRMLANHGRVDKYDHRIEGVNSRMDGLQAAVLSAKLPHLPAWTERRRLLAGLYATSLRDIEGIVLPREAGNVKAVYHLYVVRVKNGRRDRVQAHLTSKGVSTGIHYPIPLPALTAYSYLKHGADDFPRAVESSREILSLPMFAELREDQVQHVSRSVEEALR